MYFKGKFKVHVAMEAPAAAHQMMQSPMGFQKTATAMQVVLQLDWKLNIVQCMSESGHCGECIGNL